MNLIAFFVRKLKIKLKKQILKELIVYCLRESLKMLLNAKKQILFLNDLKNLQLFN